MKKFLIILLCTILALFLFLFIKHKINSRKSLVERLDSIYKPIAAEHNNSFLIVTVVGDHVEYYSYGQYSDNLTKLKRKVDSSSVFDVGSVGKLFTAATVKILDSDGHIVSDSPIAPNFKKVLKTTHHFDNVTYNDLIRHTSGFPNIPESFLKKVDYRGDSSNPYSKLSKSDVYNYLENCAGKKNKGKEEYSNLGYGLAGISLSLELNSDFNSIVKKTLFDKIGMKHTFIPKVKEELPELLIPGFTKNNEKADFWFDDTLPASGSFVSNGLDLATFMRYILGSNVKTESMLGWFYEKKILSREEFYWINGMSGGYYSFMALDKNHNVGLAILSNKAQELTFQQFKTFEILRTRSLRKKIMSDKPKQRQKKN